MPPKKNELQLFEMLEEALKPIKDAMQKLITDEKMMEHIQNLEQKILTKITEQATEIKDLKDRSGQLEGRVAVLENLIKCQEVKIDDNEQYSRRLCLRVNGIPCKSRESNKDLEQILNKEFVKMAIDLPHDVIDRVHRTGKKVEIEDVGDDGVVTGVSVLQQVIVRFRSWSHRTLIYKSRKRSKLKFKVDLTKRRNDLLKKARDLTENIAAIQYVFSDVNCRLNVRFQDDSVKGFNSEIELAQLISSCDEH